MGGIWRRDTAVTFATQQDRLSSNSGFVFCSPRWARHLKPSRSVVAHCIRKACQHRSKKRVMLLRTGQRQWTPGCSRKRHQSRNKTKRNSTCTDLDTKRKCLFLRKDNDLCTECRNVQFRHFLIEVDVVLVGRTLARSVTMFSTSCLYPRSPTFHKEHDISKARQPVARTAIKPP